jgi:hypothetical protein
MLNELFMRGRLTWQLKLVEVVRVHENILSQSTREEIYYNNNSFTWSGPSGGFGCTGQRPGGPCTRGSTASTQVEEVILVRGFGEKNI